jgi:hypothetical protein
MSQPEKDPEPQDEFERLEKLQERNKAIQDAWRNLLKNLGKFDTEGKDPNTPEEQKP